MPPVRTYVDPAFPGTLRALRLARGWSGRRLAKEAAISPAYLHEIEAGNKTNPTVEMLQALDNALQAQGTLTAMIRSAPTTADPDQRDQIIHAVQHPRQLDHRAVEALSGVLAAHRQLDDMIEARILLPGELAQMDTVQVLARDARGPAVDDLHYLAAEWTQYVGWLRAEARQDGAAVETLTQAADEAERIGNGPLLAQARNFTGYVHRQRGNPAGTVNWFEGAYLTPGATRLQRIGDAAQAAQGYALLGDHGNARRLLDEAQELALQAEADAAPLFAYWLSVTFSRLNLGLAYLALGDGAEAAQQLGAGLAGLPAQQRESEWGAEYRAALQRAQEMAGA